MPAAPPFDGDAGELIAKHQMIPAPAVRQLRPDVPAALDALVTAMLAKSPDARPQTMAAVLAALDAFEGKDVDEPTTPRKLPPETSELVDPPTEPPTTLTRGATSHPVVEKTRSRRALVLGAIGATMLGIAGGIVALHAGSSSGDVAVAAGSRSAPAVVHDAEAAAPVVASPEAVALERECLEDQKNLRWPELAECAGRLAAFEPEPASRLKAREGGDGEPGDARAPQGGRRARRPQRGPEAARVDR